MANDFGHEPWARDAQGGPVMTNTTVLLEALTNPAVRAYLLEALENVHRRGQNGVDWPTDREAAVILSQVGRIAEFEATQ